MEKTREQRSSDVRSWQHRSRQRRNFLLVLASFIVLAVGCSSHPCREPRAPELDRTNKTDKKDSVTGVVTAQPSLLGKGSAAGDAAAETVHIRVYKPDGSRQCEKRTGVPVDVMERELAGISVFGREKRKDGLMHIQVCGSPSGIVNIFEIEQSFFKQAEQRGFKRWEE